MIQRWANIFPMDHMHLSVAVAMLNLGVAMLNLGVAISHFCSKTREAGTEFDVINANHITGIIVF